jgi:hypothetical protein
MALPLLQVLQAVQLQRTDTARTQLFTDSTRALQQHCAL